MFRPFDFDSVTLHFDPSFTNELLVVLVDHNPSNRGCSVPRMTFESDQARSVGDTELLGNFG